MVSAVNRSLENGRMKEHNATNQWIHDYTTETENEGETTWLTNNVCSASFVAFFMTATRLRVGL
jgi:hypothetical protein